MQKLVVMVGVYCSYNEFHRPHRYTLFAWSVFFHIMILPFADAESLSSTFENDFESSVVISTPEPPITVASSVLFVLKLMLLIMLMLFGI